MMGYFSTANHMIAKKVKSQNFFVQDQRNLKWAHTSTNLQVNIENFSRQLSKKN